VGYQVEFALFLSGQADEKKKTKKFPDQICGDNRVSKDGIKNLKKRSGSGKTH